MKGAVSMDRLDVQIISKLQENGNSTNANIAKSIKPTPVSEETVRRRLKRLIQDEYIKVVAVPNPRKMGYESQVIIGLQVSADKVDDVSDALSGMSEVNWVSITTGSFDIFAWATVRSFDELSEFLRSRVGRIEGVQKMETFLTLESKKQEYGLSMKSVSA